MNFMALDVTLIQTITVNVVRIRQTRKLVRWSENIPYFEISES